MEAQFLIIVRNTIGILVAFAILGASGTQVAQADPLPQIWFSPRQDNIEMTQPPGHRVSFAKYDFASMLGATAPWQTAASRVSVLTIGLHTMEVFDDLPAVVAMTNRYSFGIATAGAMISTDGGCAVNGSEGIDSKSKNFAGEIVFGLKKWKLAGGRLDYIIMDSPFYFGYYAVAKDCHYSIREVARRAAATLREIRKLYPTVKVMDAEGPGATPIDAWLPVFKQWLDDFGSESGRPIDAVGMDFHWRDAWHTGYDWVSAVRTTASLLRKQGIAAGLYINAEDQNTTNANWMATNREHLKTALEGNLGLDFVYIASWTKFPDRNLPETDPTSYTSLVNDAFSYLHPK